MTTRAWPLMLIASLLVAMARVPSPAHAGSSPSPTQQRVVVHGFHCVGDPPMIDGETAALLDEAVQSATNRQSTIVLLPDSAAATDDAAQTCQAEAARTYLHDQGIALDRIQVDALGRRPLSITAGAAGHANAHLRLSEFDAN